MTPPKNPPHPPTTPLPPHPPTTPLTLTIPNPPIIQNPAPQFRLQSYCFFSTYPNISLVLCKTVAFTIRYPLILGKPQCSVRGVPRLVAGPNVHYKCAITLIIALLCIVITDLSEEHLLRTRCVYVSRILPVQFPCNSRAIPVLFPYNRAEDKPRIG